jgi:hypothetical protein
MPQPKKESLSAIIAELREELGQARTERDAALDAARDAADTAKRAAQAAVERAEEDAGRINSLKAIVAEKEGENAELRGYIKRVHELDDAGAPLAPTRAPAEAPRTRMARDDGDIRIARGWTAVADHVVNGADRARPRHWSQI